MWQVIAVAAVIFISSSTEAIKEFQTHKNDKLRILNRLDDMATESPLDLPDPTTTTPKFLKNHVKRRSIRNFDIQDDPTVHRLRSVSPSIWSYSPDIEHEKFIRPVGQRRNHALVIKERRYPSFSPWGGKRDSSVYKPGLKIRRPVRVPFNSWGGKRNGGASVIKTPFNSWGGKRSSRLIDHILTTATGMDEPLRGDWRYSVINNPELVGIDPMNLAMSNLDEIENRQDYLNLEDPSANFNSHLPRIPFGPWGAENNENNEESDEGDVSSTSVFDSE